MKPKFQIGDYVKRISYHNGTIHDKTLFRVGEWSKIIDITETGFIMVEKTPLENDPDYLELYFPTKLEKSLL